MRYIGSGTAGARRPMPRPRTAPRTNAQRLVQEYMRNPSPVVRPAWWQSGGSAEHRINRTVKQFVDPRPMVRDAYDSVRHPIRRLHSGGQMMFPLGGKIPLKEYPASLPGYTMRRAKEGEHVLDYQGVEVPHAKYKTKGFSNVVYNMHAPDNSLVGSVHMNFSSPYRDRATGQMMPADLFVSDMYLHPSLRRTSLFRDLFQPVLAAGRPVTGDIINPKLMSLVRRMAKRDPRFTHFLGPQSGDAMPKDFVPGWSTRPDFGG